MNSLIKKGILIILVLLFVMAVFSGCGANNAKTVSAPIPMPIGQAPHNGGIQLLTSDETVPETTEPETTEPETTEPETTEPETTEPETTEPETTEPGTDTPEVPAEGDIFQQISAWFNAFAGPFSEFFDWFRIRVNFFFDVLLKA